MTTVTSEPQAKKAKTMDEPLEPPEACACPIMSPSEAAAVTITFEQAEKGLARLIEEKGVAIVTDVLDLEGMAQLESALKEDMEELVDGDAVAGSDPTVKAAWERVCKEGLHSWPAASLADVGARGRFQDHGLPHGRFAWRARTHPRVKRVYEILHGTSDLVSSCDNAFVANSSQEEVSTNKYWPHVDQNDHETRLPCKEWNVYQGLLYIWSSSDSSHRSTTVIWPESHKGPYADYMADPKVAARITQGKPHFTLIAGMEPGQGRNKLIQGWEMCGRRMPVPAGALLLWTSRTTHQGWSGGPRLAQPVCWEPRSRRTAQMRQRKMRLAALGLPSTHWASLGMPHELSDLVRPSSVNAVGDAEHEKVRFPLFSSIRSQALTTTANPQELWKLLQDPKWFEMLPEPAATLLEDSIADEYKAWL